MEEIISLTAKEVRDIAIQKHHMLYQENFDRNIKNIDELILKRANLGNTNCKLCTRYNKGCYFLIYPFDKDKNTMIQNITTYYKGLGFNIIEEDELLVIEWSD